ncbi:MAG: response regulator [Chloroflexi bacterium]|nr:response regulator [Chloroflexota bacterium]
MPKIIVVDDDSTNITLIQMLLELDGFTVSSCAGVDQAKAMAEADTGAFVVDYHLARGSKGLDLLTAVRNGETAASRDAVVIITSGDYRCEAETTEAGANLFLLKPYSPDALSQGLSNMLGEGV